MLLFLSLLDGEEEKCKFAQIYEKYRYFMWYIADEMLRDEYLAEDAVQEAFLALTRHLDRVEEVDSRKTKNFLATIVKSKAIDLIRKQKGDITEEYEDALLTLHQGDALDEYLKKESMNRIEKAILELDEIYKVTFEYKYVHELSDREIGDILGVTPKTVNVRVYRARKKLQEILQREAIAYAR